MDVRYLTSIITLSDLKCGGYCFIILDAIAVFRGGLAGKRNTDIGFRFARSHLYSEAQLMSQGQGSLLREYSLL